MFLEKTNFTVDLSQILNEVDSIDYNNKWVNHQIGLKHRPGSNDIWTDCIGSLYSKERRSFIGKESDFSEWNLPNGSYIRNQIITLCDHYKLSIGRVRLMRLLPKQGLSVHRDSEIRFHLVLKTNSKAYICNNIGTVNNDLNVIANCFHLPSDSFWYKADTTQIHWVYNGGETERIHLVVCAY